MSEQKRITKRERFAVDVAVTLLAYFRTMVVFLSIVAFVERAWTGLALAVIVYFLASNVLTKTLDIPSDETIKELNAILRSLEASDE